MSNRFAKTKVRSCSRPLYSVLCWAVRLGCVLVGIRVSFTNQCGQLPEGACIVLCNHGSTLDFAYTGTFLRKSFPHYVVARYYFYNKWLSRLLKQLGAFPKSQLEVDVESTKNCLRVLQGGKVLFMMPEARVGAAGKFEDIQDGTFSFLKKVKVPVYTIRLNGSCLSWPKWANGPRRGALVESELDLLFTAQDLERLSVAQIKEAVEERLRYDEFQWLKTRPEVRYRSPRLAEGLENILTVCPRCGSRYTIRTKKREVFCAHCGKLAAIDSRYAFPADFPFANFTQWYDWQKRVIGEELSRNPDSSMESKVTLHLSSHDGKTFSRSAGSGTCTLNREGLTYAGTKDGETYRVHFPLKRVYRLIFDAGKGFQIHNGTEMLYFLPEEQQSAVEWYLASMILYDEVYQTPAQAE